MLNKIDTLEATVKKQDSIYWVTVSKYDLLVENKDRVTKNYEQASIMWEGKITNITNQLAHEKSYSSILQVRNIEYLKENDLLLKKNKRLKRTKNITFWTAVGLVAGATAYIIIRK